MVASSRRNIVVIQDIAPTIPPAVHRVAPSHSAGRPCAGIAVQALLWSRSFEWRDNYPA